MAHKHADLIHAWADGAEIQFFNAHKNAWEDCEAYTLSWSNKFQYRIKPKSIKGKYRVALFKDGHRFWTLTVNAGNHFWADTNNTETEIAQKIKEETKFFFDWLTDWVEYDVAIEE